ncbi:MAG: NADH-quinone oxidoreductase subunit [Schlesneria sp.]|nr:NADH-quinone oxidoreductase subunit [Schlesneria sp.]
MPWPRLSVNVLPLLITVSPLIGVATTIAVSRWNKAMVRPMAVSNSTFTLFLIAMAIWLPPAGDGEGLREVSTNLPGFEWLTETAANPQGSEPSGIRVRMDWWLNGLSTWTAAIVGLTVWAVLCCPNELAGESFASNCGKLLSCQALLFASTFSSDGIAAIVFLEMSVVPIYLIIGRHGDGNRRQVAGGWWMWQLSGCTCSLLGVTLLAVSQPWMQAEFVTVRQGLFFDTPLLTQGIQQLLNRSETALHIWSNVRPWGSALMLLGLLIRLPTFPVQGWYQSTLMSAPAGIAAVIAAAFPLAAFGGWLRLGMPLFGFHSGTMNGALAVAALVGLLYASIAAQSQTDLKQLLVLISCAMLCVAGIGLSFRNVDGVRAAWLMMLSQGLSIPCGLLLVQSMEARLGTRELTRLSSLVSTSPRLAILLELLLLGWTGVPVLAGFTAIYQQLAGASSIGLWLILGESIGLVALAAAGLRAFSHVWSWSPASSLESSKPVPPSPLDSSSRELVALFPFIVLLILVNAVPMYFLPAVDATIPSRHRSSHQP